MQQKAYAALHGRVKAPRVAICISALLTFGADQANRQLVIPDRGAADPPVIAYLDSSVLLRVIFAEPGQLREWKQLRLGVSSELLRTECLRTVDRMRIRLQLEDAEVARRNQSIFLALDHLEQVPVSREILDRASEPFPTTVGTLDSIHLATAILWQASEGRLFDALLTHDVELGQAARALGYRVLGCDL